jgi:hypothetical protein
MASALLRFRVRHHCKGLHHHAIMVVIRSHLSESILDPVGVVLAEVIEPHGAVDLARDPDPGGQDRGANTALEAFGWLGKVSCDDSSPAMDATPPRMLQRCAMVLVRHRARLLRPPPLCLILGHVGFDSDYRCVWSCRPCARAGRPLSAIAP